MNKGKYYITTAIAYTSGTPHIGNSYEIVLADSIARFKRKDGYDVLKIVEFNKNLGFEDCFAFPLRGGVSDDCT